MSQIEVAIAAYRVFVDEFKSLMLGTVSANGLPNVSYAPFVMDETKNIYVYVSGLSTHTQNLYTAPLASVMFIEDELQTQEIFARRRLTYDCGAKLVEQNTELWYQVLGKYEERFGEIIQQLRNLPDQRIFHLTPYQGRFVTEFGAAYNVRADNLDTLVDITVDESIY